jgi:hypothetical protein
MQFNNKNLTLVDRKTSVINATTDTVVKKISIENSSSYDGVIEYPVSESQTATPENYYGVIARSMTSTNEQPYNYNFDARYIDDDFTFVLFPYTDTISGNCGSICFNSTMGGTVYIQAVKKNSDGSYITGEPLSTQISVSTIAYNSNTSQMYEGICLTPLFDNTYLIHDIHENSSAGVFKFDQKTLKFTRLTGVSFGYTSTKNTLSTSVAGKVLIIDNNQTNNSSALSNTLYARVATFDPVTFAITYSTNATLLSANFFYNSNLNIQISSVKATKNKDEYVVAGRGNSGAHRFVHLTFNSADNSIVVDRDYSKTGFTVNYSASGISLLSLSAGDDFHVMGVSTVQDNPSYSSWFESNSKSIEVSQTALPKHNAQFWLNNPVLYRYSATVAMVIGSRADYHSYGGIYYRIKNTSTGAAWTALNTQVAVSTNYHWASGRNTFTLGDGRLYSMQHGYQTSGLGGSLYYGAVYVNGSITSISATNAPPTIGMYDYRFVSISGNYAAVLQPNGRWVTVFKDGAPFKVYGIQTQRYIFSVQINEYGDLFVGTSASDVFCNNSQTTLDYFSCNVETKSSGVYSLSSIALGNNYLSNWGVAYLDGTVLYFLTSRFDGSSTVYGYLYKATIAGGVLSSISDIRSYSITGSWVYFTSPLIMMLNGKPFGQMFGSNGQFRISTNEATTGNYLAESTSNQLYFYDNKTNLFKSIAGTLLKHNLDYSYLSSGISHGGYEYEVQSPFEGIYVAFNNGLYSVYDASFNLIYSFSADLNFGYKKFEKNGVLYDLDYFGDIKQPLLLSGNLIGVDGNVVRLFSGMDVRQGEIRASSDQVLMQAGEVLELETNYRYSANVRIETISV